MAGEDHKLDNPVWYALSEAHKDFAVGYGNIKCYDPDYCPFGGFIEVENITPGIAAYSKLTDKFFIVGEKPVLPAGIKLINELVCKQMLIEKKIAANFTEEIRQLSDDHADELSQLINIVQPGYYKRKTFLLGNYYGIFKNNQPVAVAGERMKMNEYIEVSAVVTHPDHRGRGYAKQLVAYSVNHILHQNKLAFLHVAGTNTSVIKLYEQLHFRTRRKISFWHLQRQAW